MVEITFLGGAREVGRMGMLLRTSKERFLWEYGIEVQDTLLPIKPDIKSIDAVFLSHAHIDHSGLLPQLYRDGYRGSVHATQATFDISYLLLHDSIKVQKKRGEPPLYLPGHVERLMEKRKEMNYKEPVRFGNSQITLHDAGHIPGASAPLLDTGKKRILFTGDLKFIDSKLVKGARLPEKDIDILICESTYSYKDHPPREELYDKLREMVQETVYGGGIALIPSFAVGRTQEMLLMLHDLGFPMYVDGMGIEATEIMLNNKEFLNNPQELQRAFSKARKINRSRERKNVIANPCIVITTAGMMNGGPVSYYIKNLYNREKCSLILTGYQVEGTVGRKLMDTGRYVNEGLDVKPKMRMEQMDFSAHTDRSHIIKYIKKSSPGRVIFVHGDNPDGLVKDVRAMGFDCSAPKNGDKIKV
jgi:putative mRNA 3-end processing factor